MHNSIKTQFQQRDALDRESKEVIMICYEEKNKDFVENVSYILQIELFSHMVLSINSKKAEKTAASIKSLKTRWSVHHGFQRESFSGSTKTDTTPPQTLPRAALLLSSYIAIHIMGVDLYLKARKWWYL